MKMRAYAAIVPCLMLGCSSGDMRSTQDHASVISQVVKADPDSVTAQIGDKNVVEFFYSANGKLVAYDKNYDGNVVAEEVVPGHTYRLVLERIHGESPIDLGYMIDGKLRICGTQEINGVEKKFACDALFLRASEVAETNLDARRPVIIGYDDARVSADIVKGRPYVYDPNTNAIDLQQWALPQINQYGTGTCYFNSATGILEWFYNKGTGHTIDLSEPALIGLYETGELGDIGDYKILDTTNKMRGAVPNSILPVTQYYTPSADFESVSTAVADKIASIGVSDRVELPFRLSIQKLFWYGRWQNGHTTESDYQKAVEWLDTKQSPVHLQHVVGGYWHAVIMLGHKRATGEVLIKDSLGNTNLKATWRSKSWFMTNTYGAVGVEVAPK